MTPRAGGGHQRICSLLYIVYEENSRRCQTKLAPRKGQQFRAPRRETGGQGPQASSPANSQCDHEQGGLRFPISNVIRSDYRQTEALSCCKVEVPQRTAQLLAQCGCLEPFPWPALSHISSGHISTSLPPLFLTFLSVLLFTPSFPDPLLPFPLT